VSPAPASPASTDDGLSIALACLMRGPVYEEEDGAAWIAIRSQPGRLHDHLRVLGMQLVVDDGDGYAFLRTLDELPEGMPRLMRRHRLSFTTSVLLVLLRQRMTTAEAEEATPRLVLTAQEMVEMMRLYHPRNTSHERILQDVARLEDLGYLRRLRGSEDAYEARRIIKAQVTADWLAAYATQLLAAARPNADGPDVRGRHQDAEPDTGQVEGYDGA
jgi:Domain of unknown function (DUF4194)